MTQNVFRSDSNQCIPVAAFVSVCVVVVLLTSVLSVSERRRGSDVR